MTDPDMTSPGNTVPPPAPRWRGRGRGIIFLAAIAVAGGLIGAFADRAFGYGPHMFGHFGGPGFWRTAGGPFDPAKATERAERAAKHLAVEIDATNDQQQKLIEIAKALTKEIGPQRDQFLEARKRAVELLGAPTLDLAEIEKLRAERVAGIEQISRQVTQAIVKAAETMTPEQRKKLAERIEEWREHRGWWRGTNKG